MEARAFWIHPGNGPEHDPQYMPVMLAGVAGPGVTVWLRPEGTYSYEDPSFPSDRDFS
jgi:hypothetical protein